VSAGIECRKTEATSRSTTYRCNASIPHHQFAKIYQDRWNNLVLWAKYSASPWRPWYLKISLSQAAFKAHDTLNWRSKGETSKQEARSTQLLSQEALLVQWILDLETGVFAPSHAQIREMAALVRKASGGPDSVGINWVHMFLKRHPEIHVNVGVKIDAQRLVNNKYSWNPWGLVREIQGGSSSTPGGACSHREYGWDRHSHWCPYEPDSGWELLHNQVKLNIKGRPAPAC